MITDYASEPKVPLLDGRVPQSDGLAENMLTAQSVTVGFGGLVALSDVTLAIATGEIVGLIGPNGAGKSTLVNCLSGFLRPTRGRILFDGQLTASWPAEDFRRRGVARTFQGSRLFQEMSVYENVEATALGLGKTRRQAAEIVWDLLDRLGIANKAAQRAGSLAYTDERRVGIARALVMSPQFLLLDEPAAGMTPHECDDLVGHIAQIPATFGCGVLLIEHNMRVVMDLCERIHVLSNGRTLAEGSPTEIRKNQAVISAYLGVS